MDDFVRNKLIEWRLSEWIDRFKDEDIDEESLYCLQDKEINNLILKAGPRARFKRQLQLLTCQLKNEGAPDLPQVWPSTSDKDECLKDEEINSTLKGKEKVDQVLPSTSLKGKRKSDHHGEMKQWQSPAKRPCETTLKSNLAILSDVKNIMTQVCARIEKQDKTKLNAFLREKIDDLETDKRELVGVFGRSGAGKSSLINAIIGEKNLLPTGGINACTTVMIKVEANVHSSEYEAKVEFITKEEWKDELWSVQQFLGANGDQKKKDGDNGDASDSVEKLSALYGEEYKNKTSEELMDSKYFREIPEFLQAETKIFKCGSAKELSANLIKYTKSDSNVGGGKKPKKLYWPLVKCVTFGVPGNDLLQHVTLVDLPGNGDRNKSRDKMWKEVVRDCSTVWIVTDINRAASEPEPWEILENASSLMGNGGECQQIHFICTKSDQIDNLDNRSAAQVYARIQKRNIQTKEVVRHEFSKQNTIRKLFSEKCFNVFTVSSHEFIKRTPLTSFDTEIPKLKEFLQNLNDSHSEALNYVSGAYGILSLIYGARLREGAGSRTDVCADLEKNMSHQLDKVKKTMDEAYKAFEKCLSDGVEKSKSSCQRKLKSFLYPTRGSGGFHGTLKCVVQHNGIHKPKKKRPINFNMILSSHLTGSIDEEFKKTFPNDRKCEPFNGVISKFSLDTERLIEKYKDVELQLIFLETEENKMKTKLKKDIRDRKKKIYSSLTETIEENMRKCYKDASEFSGVGTLENMRETIQRHVNISKNNMFEQAKNVHLNLLKELEMDVLKTLKTTMMESIELSLKTDDCSIPDVSYELAKVKWYQNQLKVNKKD